MKSGSTELDCLKCLIVRHFKANVYELSLFNNPMIRDAG